jgi:hypothetical protein
MMWVSDVTNKTSPYPLQRGTIPLLWRGMGGFYPPLEGVGGGERKSQNNYITLTGRYSLHFSFPHKR